MLAKVAGQDRFKVGNGKSSWSELPWSTDILNGGGLSINSEGKVYVDFSQMPTDKFEALLKQLRLPIWLTEHTNVYINADTGSDVLSEGRGFSEDKPFKTVNAAYYYIVNNYNLNVYNVYFNLHGTFTEYLVVNGYTSTGGVLVFRSYINSPYSGKLIWTYSGSGMASPFTVYAGKVYIYDLEITLNVTSIGTGGNWFPAALISYGNSSTIYIHGPHVTIRLTNKAENYIELRCIVSSMGGAINIQAHETFNTWIIVENSENLSSGSSQYLRAESNANINIQSSAISQEAVTIYCAGSNVNGAIAYESSISVNIALQYKPMFKTLPGKSCTGRRYWIGRDGKIWTGGLGENFFPGTIAGYIDTSGGKYN